MPEPKADMMVGQQYRDASFVRESVNVDERTVELSFSSEEPCQRWWGNEILDHGLTSVRLQRLNTGGPLLVSHSSGDQVGVIVKASIGSDRKGRASVRFGKSARASEIFQDVQDGIRQNVSVGYRIHSMVLESEKDFCERVMQRERQKCIDEGRSSVVLVGDRKVVPFERGLH